jgi:hypothetical protein
MESETRECPYCKEEIKAEAIKCKHCGSSVAPEKPSHGGTCPYCKEQIHVEAIKCKHCGSDLRSGLSSDCGCKQQVTATPQTVTTMMSPVSGLSQATQQGFETDILRQSNVIVRPGDIIIIVGPGGPCRRVLVPCTVCNPLGCGRALCDVIVCGPEPPIIV